MPLKSIVSGVAQNDLVIFPTLQGVHALTHLHFMVYIWYKYGKLRFEFVTPYAQHEVNIFYTATQGVHMKMKLLDLLGIFL